LKAQIEPLFANGDWERALLILQQVPEQKMEPAYKELLAMAYLYTSSRLDAAENYDKAKALYSELANAGGNVRFYVSRSHESHKPDVDLHLVHAIPGQLIVSKTSVQFVPQEGMGTTTETWNTQDIAGCKPNDGFGSDSGSFHISTAGNKDVHLRPLHLSTEEADLICQLVPKTTTNATTQTDNKKDKSKKH
jgi:hypothetical protein